MRRLTAFLAATLLVGAAACSDDNGSSGLPGGKHGKEVLGEGWFNRDGKLWHPEAAPPEAKQAALCDYLYGTPAEVAKLAKLDGEVTLSDDSGFINLGGNGFQYGCTYEVDGTKTYKVAVWFGRDERETIEEAQAGAAHLVTVDLPTDVVAYSMYAPEYTGEAIGDATARRWLTAARDRIEPSLNP